MNLCNLTRGLSAEGSGSLGPPSVTEESLVADARAGLTPSQMVDRQVALLLHNTQLPVTPLDRDAPISPGSALP